jgi:hypothetical protein
MTIDMTNNRVPYGLLTDEEKAALREHEKAGGVIELCTSDALGWGACVIAAWFNDTIYRTVHIPKTQDVIAWEKLPDWVEWVARDSDEGVFGYDFEPLVCVVAWSSPSEYHRRIDDFPGIVQVGTCNWRDSKQRRPRG